MRKNTKPKLPKWPYPQIGQEAAIYTIGKDESEYNLSPRRSKHPTSFHLSLVGCGMTPHDYERAVGKMYHSSCKRATRSR